MAGLTSPVGAYQPQVLMLAPPDGEDANTLSLLAQFVEMGISVELDERWRLPTRPPKDLSAYQACFFPEHPDTVRQYDADLDAFVNAGGFVPYVKYYPIKTGPSMQGGHHFYELYGRDVYMYTLANLVVEAGVDVPHAGFRQTLLNRDLSTMLAEQRASYVPKFLEGSGRWGSWGDPQYTQFLVNFHLAETLGDAQWLAAAVRCAERLNDTVGEFIADRYRFQEIRTPGVVQCMAAIMAEVLMYYGNRLGRGEWIESGVKLGQFYMDHAVKRGDVYQEPYHRQIWSETLYTLPTMIGLARFGGRKQYREEADRMMRSITATNLTKDGLWLHWTDARGGKGLSWSRGNQWGLLWPTRALMMMEDHGGSDARFIVDTAKRVYDGLARHQDASGLWHLVVDEPATRLESSGTAGIIYCHERLRELGLLDGTHDAMIERAVQGMKGFWYDAGLACSCRGTATGIDPYYRTRPMGFFRLNLYPAAFGKRAKESMK